MWLASLVGGQEIIAEAENLQQLHAELNKLDLADGVELVVFWTGEEAPPELVDG